MNFYLMLQDMWYEGSLTKDTLRHVWSQCVAKLKNGVGDSCGPWCSHVDGKSVIVLYAAFLSNFLCFPSCCLFSKPLDP
jgi:hypothetical protein